MMKLTKKVALEVAINALTNSAVKDFHYAGEETTFTADEVIAKLMGMVEELEKRNSAPKKPTAKQKENESATEELLRVLRGFDKPMTISELMEFGAYPDGVSNQKATSLMKKLVDAGYVERTVDKRKAYFKALPIEVEA
jgi:hypothetical protein